MNSRELLERFSEIASNPRKQMERYLTREKRVVLTAPVYTPEEIIHSMGAVPMWAWGADLQLKEAKAYFPAFICSIVQSILELGTTGAYEGASAVVIPSLCDSLKVLGENWKYAVPSIPFIPMTYPQNRKPSYGAAYTKAGYERVIGDLEKAGCEGFDDERLKASIEIYNKHNQVMRELALILRKHSSVTARQRSDVFKSAGFLLKEEHTALVEELIEALNQEPEEEGNLPVMTSGILADSPSLLAILDEYGFTIAADDIAAESRQYRQDVVILGSGLDSLANKFAAMDCCSVLYDPDKKRVGMITDTVKEVKAKGLILVLTKFCDPEEFDYPLIKKACDKEGIPVLLIEVDRQMQDYAQARTMIETFRDILS